MTKLLKPFLVAGNVAVRQLLRSWVHWPLSRNVVLLEITGRRSGRRYMIPVNYMNEQDGISVMTHRRGKWWLNLLDVETVRLYLRGRRREVRVAVILDDLDAISASLNRRSWARRTAVSVGAEDTVLIRLRFPADRQNSVATST